ncbi:MAG: chemotaxis protein CheR [Actinobacteria bacterium 13_1_20CM_4_66_15]|nr:MAG: chemotaxis protein CheR [Actinobacteria bacterium 13_1_20CM_4_66_15]
MALEAGPAFEKLIEYLRDTRGFDFTGYKRASLLRRVSLRCSELSIDNFRAYLDYLQVHTEEFGSLFNKILINVTEFFRDKETWDYLAEKVIPRIAAKTGEIRVWSTGTSSGEEAYSAAILLCEALGEESFVDRVKIYATDVDEEALAKARGGYTAKELASVDDGLRLRYFERQGERFMFRTALRRTIIFGRHDLTQDAPISRLDLLICRNTLIYFMAETQGRILARFHYALNDDGYLFLGRAEMLLTHAALFTPVDVKERIFTKVASLHLQDRLVLLAQSGSKEATNHIARQLRVRELTTEGTPYPQIVVDAAGILISANQPARLLFTIPADDLGRSLKDLELSYKPVDLRTPIDRINRERRPVSMPSVEIKRGDGTPGLYDIQAAPLIDDDGSLVGIVINYVDITHASQLRSELERLGQELQSHKEELETTNEELQSTVEELETTNEELQSTNEELETLNEELESTNAELNSINTDLQLRTREVERLNTLLLAVTGNIEVGAAVLDGGMRVQLWNERAADLWGVRSEEVVGNSFFNLDIGLPAEQLRGLIRAGTGGRPLHDELVVKATTRKGREIRCRVIAHAIGDGDRSAGVVLVMEELKP